MNKLFGFNRFHLLMIQILAFSLIYMMLGSSHFSGINTLEDILRNEIVQKQVVVPIIEEKFIIPPAEVKNGKARQIKDEKAGDVKGRAGESDIEVRRELDVLITKDSNLLQRFFLRFYFSFVTGSTLGYGDTTPSSVLCRTIAMVQLVSTFFILLI